MTDLPLVTKLNQKSIKMFNPSNAKLKPICHLLALLGAHHIFHVSRIRVNNVIYVFLFLDFILILTEVFPCFFLSCKANAMVKLAKTGHGPHSSKLVVICVVLLLFMLFYVLFVCKCVLYYCHRVTTQLQLTNISYHKVRDFSVIRSVQARSGAKQSPL